ncbi:MAG: S8 family serine peptidase, partial [Acidobacteriota bacterium]|nr:S8 family serine peptidase [Acidobacteriota bacterium]
RLLRVSNTGQQDDLTALSDIGIELLDYLNGMTAPGTAYLGSFSPELAIDDPRFQELVRCLLPLEPGDKIDRDLSSGPRGDGQPVLVQLFRDLSEEDGRNLFAELGIPAEPFAPGLWQAAPVGGELAELAGTDAVMWLEPKLVDDLLDLDEVRDVHGAEELQDLDTTNGVYGGLSGDGVQIGIMDSGVDDDHNDFAGRIIRFLDNGGDHGSHVAGIAAGSGFQSDKNDDAAMPNGGTPFQWRGIAPESEIAAYGTNGASAGGSAGTMSDAINNFGVDVSNHSYSAAPSGRYNALMAAIDTIIRGNAPGIPARPQTWSAGNGGTSAQYGNNLGYFALTKTCKNCTILANVTKGSIHAGGSSMGPTADGRLKPDVATVGSSVTSVGADADRDGNPATGNGYRVKTGTSMASPAGAGIVALMLEQYAETFAV